MNKKPVQKNKKPTSRITQIWENFSIRLSHKDRLVLFKYLSVLLGAGLAIDEAVKILQEQSKGSQLIIMNHLAKTLAQGAALSEAFVRFPKIFSPVVVGLVAAGESAGTLQANLTHLSDQMQKDYELQQKVRGALMYPAVIVSAALAIAISILVFVLPNISGVYTALKLELPLPTRILLFISNLIVNNGLLALLGLVAVGLVVYFLPKISLLRPTIHWMYLHIPVIGSLSKKSNVARLTRLTGTMLESGMSIDDILPVLFVSFQNEQYKRLLADVRDRIVHGDALSVLLSPHKSLVPTMAVRVIEVGEQAGSLSQMLVYLADFYEKEIDEMTKNLSSLLEPFLLIMIGLMVGGLAVSILLPIYQVVDAF